MLESSSYTGQLPEPTIHHHIARLWTEDESRLLNSVYRLEDAMVGMSEEMKLRIFNIIKKPFAPIGVSIIEGLEESHFGIHTWPEFGYAHLEVVACGESDLSVFDRVLIKQFNPSVLSVATIDYQNIFTDVGRKRVYKRVEKPSEQHPLGIFDLHEIIKDPKLKDLTKPPYIRKYLFREELAA